MSRLSSADAKLACSAATIWPRWPAGVVAMRWPALPCWTAVTRAGTRPARAGTPARALVKWLRRAVVKIVPNAAMLTAMPSWRKVVLTPGRARRNE